MRVSDEARVPVKTMDGSEVQRIARNSIVDGHPKFHMLTISLRSYVLTTDKRPSLGVTKTPHHHVIPTKLNEEGE